MSQRLAITAIVLVALISLVATFLPLFDIDEVAGFDMHAVSRISYIALLTAGIAVLATRRRPA